jgi:SPP1 gp7 family putative phage head morphogenesis protein
MNIIQTIAQNKKLTKKQIQKINFKVVEPKSISVEYLKELKILANELKKDIREKLIPALQDTSIIQDSVAEVMTVLTTLQTKYSNIMAFSERVASGVVTSINRYNKNKFNKKGESQLGVNIDVVMSEGNIDEVLALEIRKQMTLIKSIPDEFLKEVEVIVSNGISNGLRHEEIARQLKGIKNINSTFGKLDNRVKLIARNEVGNVNSTLNKVRQQNAGIDLYKWSTSEDEIVRDNHKVMNNKYCRWDDATVCADTIEDAISGKWKKRSSIGGIQKHPGIDYNCRCVALAVIPGFD